MRRILAATGVAALVALMIAPATLAEGNTLKFKPELTRQACGGGTLVVDVEQHVLNDADSGSGGNNWALDHYGRHIRVWRQGPNTFCATVRYEGEFTTFAGISPGATGTVDAGITGEMAGGYRTTHFTATLLASPGYPTQGNIGTFDYGCDVAGTCPGRVSWLPFYFSGVTNFDLDWWGWTYQAEHNGSWINAVTGNSGDITGSATPDD